MYDALTGVDGGPAHAAHAPHVRGQTIAPAADVDRRGMTAALAARSGEKSQTRPAASADNARFAMVQHTSAARANNGQDEVRQCGHDTARITTQRQRL
jgi:hypothetical protein